MDYGVQASGTGWGVINVWGPDWDGLISSGYYWAQNGAIQGFRRGSDVDLPSEQWSQKVRKHG